MTPKCKKGGHEFKSLPDSTIPCTVYTEFIPGFLYYFYTLHILYIWVLVLFNTIYIHKKKYLSPII